MGATQTLERIAASFGLLDGGVASRFVPSLDVPLGGLLFAVPALLSTGLFKDTAKFFGLPRGYYQLVHIFLLVAFMALGRIRSVEQLRYESPGEWGKLLGLDRIPEVRTLRAKIAHLATSGEPEAWSSTLCSLWMNQDPEAAATLYIDGHVRVYHGKQTKLPRHYVAREKLCLRATTDYWVNAMDGQPFVVVNKAVDPGMIKVLEEDIVPRLEIDVPNQPSPERLVEDPFSHRFALVFDREGYSPGLFARMKAKRIACQTYHKYPGDDWPEEEFESCIVRLSSGQSVEMALAERGVFLGNQVWVREIRKKTRSGKQTSILSTDYRSSAASIAASMFARWSQENFFRYMREHYGLDRLIDFQTEETPETIRVVNPAWRQLDGEIRRDGAQLSHRLAKFGGIHLNDEIDPKKVEAYEKQKTVLKEEIDILRPRLDALKAQRKSIPKHIYVGELPEEERFRQLSTSSKHFIDSIKMIAYRAETAMSTIVREGMSRTDDARSLIRAIHDMDADILPDQEAQTLTVRIHHLANRCSDQTLRLLCEELNATQTIFPGTDLRLVYQLVSSEIPRDQEV